MSREQEIAQIQSDSLRFYTDVKNYSDISRTKDHKIMVDCIHPTAPGCVHSPEPAAADELKVKGQTPGGAVGIGLDRALGLTVVRGKLVRIREGIDIAVEEHPSVVLDAHHGCAAVAGMFAVLGEIIDPSEFTQDGFARWDRRHRLGFSRSKAQSKIRDAAKWLQEDLAAQDDRDSLVQYVDHKYPDRPNVRHMTGENKSRIYTQIFHTEVGVDRGKQASAGTEIQGYVDNLDTMLDITRRAAAGGRERYLNIGALGIRSFAVRSVLTREHPETVFLEVRPSDKNEYGLEVVEQEGPNG